MVVGLLNRALKLASNDTCFLIGAKCYQLGGNLGKTILINLRGGNSAFNLGQFDFSSLNLCPDLSHLVADGLNFLEAANCQFVLVELFFRGDKLGFLSFLIRLGFNDFRIKIYFLCLKRLRLVFQHLNLLLQFGDLSIGFVERLSSRFKRVLLGRDLC